MDEMEEKLGAILNDPETMGKIMAMAQSLGAQEPKQDKGAAPEPMPDLGMLKNLSGLTRQAGIDKQQQALLRALNPYLSGQRLKKLENAMRAAKMARMAVSVLGIQGGKFPTGR